MCVCVPSVKKNGLSLWSLYELCNPICTHTDSYAELMEVNHDDEVVDIERFNISQEMEDVTLESMQPAEQEVAKRLTTPIVNTFLDTKDIAFERQDGFSAFFSLTMNG